MRFFVDDVPLKDADRRWDVLVDSIIAPPLTARIPNVNIPGLDGSIYVPTTLEAPQMVLKLVIRGNNDDELWRNYSAVTNLMRNAKLLERSTGAERVGSGVQFVSASEPSYLNITKHVHVTYVLRLAEVYWRGEESTWFEDTISNPMRVTTFDGITGPVTDSLILFKGPGTNPKISCGDSWVQLNETLGGSDYALIDCKNFTARVGSNVTWNGGGTVKTGSLETSGGPYCLILQNTILASDPRTTGVFVDVDNAAEVSIRGRTAYML